MKVLKLFLIVGIVAFGLGIVVIWQAQSASLPWIAFEHYFLGNSEIYVIRADGNEQRSITKHPANDFAPAWSPNGKWIAFVSERDGNYEIYLIDPKGGNLKRLTDHLAMDSHPAWSPDSRWIAFASNRDGNSEIYMMDISGQNLKNLTRHPAFDNSPAWSPDGKRIAFASIRQGNHGYDVYIMNLEGGELQAIAPHPAEDGDPSWSPDGKKLAFHSSRASRDGYTKIFLFDLETEKLKDLSQDRFFNIAGLDMQPAFSPDGKQIAFASSRARNEAPQKELKDAIYVMDIDGRNIRRVTENPGSWDMTPTWFDPSIPSPFSVDWLGKWRSTWGEVKRKF